MVMFRKRLLVVFLMASVVVGLGLFLVAPNAEGQNICGEAEYFLDDDNECLPKVVDYINSEELCSPPASLEHKYVRVPSFGAIALCVHVDSELNVIGSECGPLKVKYDQDDECYTVVEAWSCHGSSHPNHTEKRLVGLPEGWTKSRGSNVIDNGWCQVNFLPTATPPPPPESEPDPTLPPEPEAADCDEEFEVWDREHELCFPKVVGNHIHGCEAGEFISYVYQDRYYPLVDTGVTSGSAGRCIHIASDLYLTSGGVCNSSPGFIKVSDRDPEEGYSCFPVVVFADRPGSCEGASPLSHYSYKKPDRVPEGWSNHRNSVFENGYCQANKEDPYWAYPEAISENPSAPSPNQDCVPQVSYNYNSPNPEECGGINANAEDESVDEPGNPIGYDSCEDVPKSRTVGWIICNALGLVDDALGFVEENMSDLLRIEASYYQTNDKYLDMWKSFRDLATVAIVATALFMILSTALNFGFFSDYTVKKYLPRLVIGIIFIQLSWALSNVLLQLVNELGDGLEFLISSVIGDSGFKDFGLATISSDTLYGEDASRSGVAAGQALGTVGIIALIGGVGGLGAVLYAYTAATMLLMGFAFLLIRKFIIIALMVFSPLGLALWILPGSDNAWKFYRKTFFTLVLLYPIIISIIAIGKVFAWIIVKSDSSPSNENDVIDFFLASGAYIAGFVAIPFIAKRFSGTLGQLTGMINDKSKGLIDKGRNSIEGFRTKRKEFKQGVRQEGKVEKAGYTGDNTLKKIRAAKARASLRLGAGMRYTGRDSALRLVTPMKPSLEKRRTKEALSASLDKLKEERVDQADAQLRQDPENIYSNFEKLLEKAKDSKQSEAVRRAATRRLSVVGADNHIRQLSEHVLASAAAGDRSGQAVWRGESQKGTFNEHFKDSAQDIAKSQPEGHLSSGQTLNPDTPSERFLFNALAQTNVEQRRNWSVHTWDKARKQHQGTDQQFVDGYIRPLFSDVNWNNIKPEAQGKILQLAGGGERPAMPQDVRVVNPPPNQPGGQPPQRQTPQLLTPDSPDWRGGVAGNHQRDAPDRQNPPRKNDGR